MANKSKPVNWEKIGIYLTSILVFLALWGFLNQTQRDLSDLKERIARLEVKIQYMEKK